jgi:dUTP pyrophosphatase
MINLSTDLNSLKDQAEALNKYLDENFEDDTFKMILDETGVDIGQMENEMMSYSPKLTLKYKKLRPESTDPYYNYPSDSGFDLFATEDTTIQPLGRGLVRTGLSFDIKDGYEIQVRSKSGLAINQGLFVMNSPGTVDNGFTGEIQVIVFNTNSFEYTVKQGSKIAQAVLCPVVNGKWVELEETSGEIIKDRNANGFGSTGI